MTIDGIDEVNVKSRVAQIGDIINAEKIELGDEVQVNGDLDAQNEIKIGSRGNVTGNIDSGGEIQLGSGASVGGAVNAADKLKAGEDFEAGSSLFAGAEIELGARANVSGNVLAQEKIDIKEDSTINGSITTVDEDADIDLGNRVVVNGDIDSAGSVKIKEDARINGTISSVDDVKIDNRTVVDGSIDSGDEVELGEDARVTGNINAKGDVELKSRSEVGGYVNAPNGDGDLGDGSVRGPTCDQNNNIGGCNGNNTSAETIGDWHFDEQQWQGNEDEVLDASGNNNHGEALRNAETNGFFSAIAGTVGTCRYGTFDGTNRVQVPRLSALSSADSVSVSLWFKGAVNDRIRMTIMSPTKHYWFRGRSDPR